LSSERRWLLGALLLAAVGCADLQRGAAVGPADAASAAEVGSADAAAPPLSFARDVHHLLVDGCARCHTSNGAASRTSFLLVDLAEPDRQQALAFVDQDNPAGSRLLAKASGAGHGGGTVYAAGTPEYQTVLVWIMQGSAP
jgi:hypothetical protein